MDLTGLDYRMDRIHNNYLEHQPCQLVVADRIYSVVVGMLVLLFHYHSLSVWVPLWALVVVVP